MPKETCELTLFDDDSVKEKLRVMSKWDAMFDDSRNPDEDFGERVENMFQLGKTYRITIEEIPCPKK